MPMQYPVLPELINPHRLAEKRAKLQGTLLLASMLRLKEALADTVGEAIIDMQFDRDENNTPLIHLKVSTNLILKCQRCLENFSYPISVDVLLSPMTGEEEIAKMQGKAIYEPLVMEGGTVKLQDIVEDEILLSLPLIAKHAQEACSMVLSEPHEDNIENPFKTYFSKTGFRGKKR